MQNIKDDEMCYNDNSENFCMTARGAELNIYALNKECCLDDYKLPKNTELLEMKAVPNKLPEHDGISYIRF